MSSRDGRSGRDGFVLVAVMWILAALAGLAGMYSSYVAVTTRTSSIYVDRVRTEAAVYSALEMTAYRLGASGGATSSNGTFEFPLDDAVVRVAYAPESARVDLNLAPKETLVRLLMSVGAAPRDAAAYADRVIGWRSGGEDAGQSPEAFGYASAKLPYPPREGPFVSVEELWNVRSLPAWLVRRVLPLVTVFGTAPDAPLDARKPGAVRISVSVAHSASVTEAAEAVIVPRENGDVPYDVLSWRAD